MRLALVSPQRNSWLDSDTGDTFGVNLTTGTTAETHILDLQSLVDRLATCIDGIEAIACKRFFNGAAAYVDGHIFMTLTPVGLALKLPEHDRTALLANGASRLQYFPKAPIKKDYVILPDRITGNDDALAPLVKTSISFVLGSL